MFIYVYPYKNNITAYYNFQNHSRVESVTSAVNELKKKGVQELLS